MSGNTLLTIEEYKAMLKKAQVGKARKYRNTPTTVDGVRFDSKLEAARYRELVLLHLAKKISYFLRQVPFHLPGGIIYRCDFMVVSPISTAAADVNVLRWQCVTYEDCKGFETRAGKNKIKQVEAIYGVKIELLRRR